MLSSTDTLLEDYGTIAILTICSQAGKFLCERTFPSCGSFPTLRRCQCRAWCRLILQVSACSYVMAGVACLLRGACTRNLLSILNEGVHASGALRPHSELTHLRTSHKGHTPRKRRLLSTDAKQETTMSGRRQVPNPHMTEVAAHYPCFRSHRY